MRLARKLTLTLLAGVLVVVAALGWLDVRRQVQQLERSMADELSTLAHATAAATARLGGEPGPLLEEVSRKGDIRLALVRQIVAPAGEVRIDDERLYVYRRLSGDTAIEASQSLAEVRAAARQAAAQAAGAAGVIVVLFTLYASGVGIWLVGRPVERMSGRLAETLEQLRHAERLTTVGRLASGVAHELGTPLNVVQSHAKLLETGDAEPDSARIIGEQAARMTAIIRQLLDFARSGHSEKAVGDLGPLVRRTLHLLAPVTRKKSATVRWQDPPRPMLVRMDDGQLQQVITNLFLNAVQAMPGGGEVQVALEEAGDAVRLTVADQGQGIAAEALPRIFDPFFTTKGVGEGTGLGLSVAYGIVKEHGGWIDVESLPGRGTRFFVHLPRTEAA